MSSLLLFYLALTHTRSEPNHSQLQWVDWVMLDLHGLNKIDGSGKYSMGLTQKKSISQWLGPELTQKKTWSGLYLACLGPELTMMQA